MLSDAINEGDRRERGTRETRPTPRLRTNFEVSIQQGVIQFAFGSRRQRDWINGWSSDGNLAG
jgi:hypothetical protein